MLDNLSFHSLFSLLQQQNSPSEIVTFVFLEILFWVVLSLFFIQFLPKKYTRYKKEIFIFFLVINVGLLFIGILLTLLMILFGLSWATHRESHPDYEMVFFEDHVAEFPVVFSKFQEGILTTQSEHSQQISTDEKIKSLRILYDSNAEGNIGKIKNFLGDSSDETRLYAFALISSFENKLNTQIKELQEKVAKSYSQKEKNHHQFELAFAYWQFIFHGVASEKLSVFYTNKIKEILQEIEHYPRASVLLGKIHIFHKKYEEAEKAFEYAIALGVPRESILTFLAEIKFAQKKYNEVANYISPELFEIDLRLKPLAQMWGKS